MPVYTYYRKKKWFSYIGAGSPGDYVQAIYRGTDPAGRPDPLLGPNGGVPGQTYIVGLLTDKSTAVSAPCPDFCNGGESFVTSKADRAIMNAFERTREQMDKQFKKERRKLLSNPPSGKGAVPNKTLKPSKKAKTQIKGKGKSR